MYQNGSDLTVLACNDGCLHVRGHPTFSSPLESSSVVAYGI